MQGIQPYFLAGLKLKAYDHGFTISQEKETADVRVLVDPLQKIKLENNRDVVIVAEPEVVRPDLYSKEFLDTTKYLLPLGKYRADRLNLENFINWPVDLPKYKKVKKTKNQKIAIVNEHKFSSSKRSQYGLRREVINYFEKTKPGKLDLFGVEWNVSRMVELKRRFYALRNNNSILSIDLKETFSDLWKIYESAQGHMHQDCEPLQEYSASICIENDIDYVSEKLWKSLYAGCPVIYVGPCLKYDTYLKNCLIPADDNLDSIVSRFESFNSETEEEYSVKGLDFINSKEFKDYSLEAKIIEFYSNLKSLLKI
jgi:hypothetical protein